MQNKRSCRNVAELAHAGDQAYTSDSRYFESFVDEVEVAKFLSLTPRRVVEMARKQQIPSHPIGCQRKTWRFRLSEIDGHFKSAAGNLVGGSMGLAVSRTQERKRLGQRID